MAYVQSQLIPLLNPAPRRYCGCRFRLLFVREELALVSALQLAVGDATNRCALVKAVEVASHSTSVVVYYTDVVVDSFVCVGASSQQ
jgi:hypothetical protein